MPVPPSTGMDGFDEVVNGLRMGDNVVWQVETIDDYRHYVAPYVDRALTQNRNIIYIRFAQHPSLLENRQGLYLRFDEDQSLVESRQGVTTFHLDPAAGFESFSREVHQIIKSEGVGAYYLFDCLSDLLTTWATDLMVGNFFMITCPYLYELDTIAYFALLRGKHSYKTIARIRDTTQLLLDVYDFEGDYYVHPLKVLNRYTPTMFLPHRDLDGAFEPITSSIDASRVLTRLSAKGVTGPKKVLDYWDRLFIKAQTLKDKPPENEIVRKTVEQLCKIMIGRDKRMLSLARQLLTLDDLINIKNRLVGTGYIGGKAVGMLMSQKALQMDTSYNWSEKMEPHDSFYIGSDVFYSYIVENGWWKLLMQQKTPQGYFSVSSAMRENLLHGKFPDEIREQFQEVIEYFGQSPIIVRSSSLLEDSFGNAFAGKYESIFLPNQGDPYDRYAAFEEAVRQIYASTMNEDALTYRLQRGLDQMDEQMALLVQRVSGSHYGNNFFPFLAGVGVSYNTFVWQKDMDPQAGMLRIVFGLGTRAVERVEDDYPQIVALDQPLLRPYSRSEDMVRFSQHKVDLLQLDRNELGTVDAWDVLNENQDVNFDLIATIDYEAQRRMREAGMRPMQAWLLTFEKLLSETDFPQVMQRMLKTLEDQYQYPVDIEFTANPTSDQDLHINLVQCRPLQTKGLTASVSIPGDISPENILFESQGHNMGGNISSPLTQIIYVDPAGYQGATQDQKYDIARLVGKINREIVDRETSPTLLLGPGRWGTSTPSLGVPVRFAEINKISVLGEIAYEGGNLMPELSFGTHFFQDLVETDIFYVALFPQEENVRFNTDLIMSLPDKLMENFPESEKYSGIVKVLDVSDRQLQIMCDVISQRVVCFFS